MTCRELLAIEHKKKVDRSCVGGCEGCPHDYDYAPNPYDCNGDVDWDKCTRCWDREADEAAVERVVGPTSDTLIGINILNDFAKEVCNIDTSNMSVKEAVKAVQDFLNNPNVTLSSEHERMLYLVKEMFGIVSPSGKKFSDMVKEAELPTIGDTESNKEELLTVHYETVSGGTITPDVTKRKLFEPKILDSGDRTEFDTGAVRDCHSGKGDMASIPWEALLRLSVQYENGAKKYDRWNFRKGIPISSFIDSACRHLAKYQCGCDDEDHLAAAAFNVLGAMLMENTKPEMQDLPMRKEKNTFDYFKKNIQS